MLSFAITARHHADVPNVYLGEEEAATLLLQHQVSVLCGCKRDQLH
jgi:hypothetical protein